MTEATDTSMLHGDTAGGEAVVDDVAVNETTVDTGVETIADDGASEPAAFTLPEQFADNPIFEGINSVEALAEKIASQPNAPESIEGYQTAIEGLDDTSMTGFRTAALDAGMTVDQYDKVIGFYNESSKAAQQQMSDRIDTYVESVKTDWGEDFEGNVRTANEAVAALDTDKGELKQLLSNPAIGSHPVVLRLFHRIGTMISDDTIRTGDAPAGGQKGQPVQAGTRYFSSYDKTMETK